MSQCIPASSSGKSSFHIVETGIKTGINGIRVISGIPVFRTFFFDGIPEILIIFNIYRYTGINGILLKIHTLPIIPCCPLTGQHQDGHSGAKATFWAKYLKQKIANFYGCYFGLKSDIRKYITRVAQQNSIIAYRIGLCALTSEPCPNFVILGLSTIDAVGIPRK